MPFRGTYQDNKRAIIKTAPDCLVYLNGELALPSGGNPTRRVNIQPYVTSVSVNLGVENSPGSASLSLHIPRHATDDFFRGGQLILTTMMEVRIYMKGHFLVGGAPRYYPVFWGVVTSVSHQWSGGERTVDLSCQDILYWWSIQRININPSYQGAGVPTQGKFNTKSSGVFTGKNPYDVIYSLARYAYGDAVNANIYLKNRQQRTEPTNNENFQLMAYWTRKWGRISQALRMYGPNGDVLQGSLLAAVLSNENRQAAFAGRAGSSKRNRSKNYSPFAQGDVNLNEISAFSQVLSRIGSFDLFTSEFQTKKEIADTAKTAIGYELFMDVTGEIIFKPPFYNLDVMPNKPVSWIRPIDLISESYAENPPDVTFLEGTGNAVRNTQIGEPEVAKPRATYVDYRLVAKYGWKPGSYNSEFFGAGLGVNASRNLFYHLVDELDRQNARIHTATVSIPLRPELRLGYPIYLQSADAYYYVEGISHTFSFGGNCTTTLTLMARRTKFYAAFPFWSKSLDSYGDRTQQLGESNQPDAGEQADPNLYPSNLYSRPIDPISGNPEGDRNVILTSVADSETAGDPVSSFEETETEAEAAYRDLVSFRTQFRLIGPFDYVYQIDPNRDEPVKVNGNGNVTSGPLTKIEVQPITRGGRTYRTAVFPVSDERGYEVIGGYQYGRNIVLKGNTFDFSRQGDRRSRMLLNLSPDLPDDKQGSLSIEEDQLSFITSNPDMDTRKDQVTQIDPNNYGRRLFEISPGRDGIGAISYARGVARSLGRSRKSTNNPSGSYAGVPDVGPSDRSFNKSKQVSKWTSIVERAREAQGVSAEQYPTSLLLSFIHVESLGKADARRDEPKTANGKSEFCGLLQIGINNAGAFGKKNTDFLGNGRDDEVAAQASIEHFIKYQERYKSRHGYNPDKMAIVWKGGPRTMLEYNQLEISGASASQLVGFLSARFGTDKYVGHIREARAIWENPPPEEELVELSAEEEDQVNLLGFPPEGDTDAGSNLRFQRALESNRQDGVEALPSFFKPVRDPSIMTAVNDFLREIYERAFQREGAVEDRLRGKSLRRLRVPDPADAVTTSNTPVNSRVVDTPLGRDEVQDALDRGESLTDIFSPEGVWGQVQEDWQNAKAQFNDAGEAISSVPEGEFFSAALNPDEEED